MGKVTHSPLTADRFGGRYSQVDRGATSIHTPGKFTTQTLPEPVVIDINVSTFEINIPSLDAGASKDVSFQAPLGLTAFTLTQGVPGFIALSLSLVDPGDIVLVTLSQQLSYGGVATSNVWSIPPGGNFAGGQVQGIARAFAPVAANAQTLTALCSAVAYAIPPSS